MRADGDQALVQRSLDAFESAWRQGSRPNLEDYLSREVADRTALLVELIHLDLEYRLAAGESSTPEDYLRRFPELGEQAAVELIAADFELRHRQTGPTPEEYLQRFPHYREALQRHFCSASPAAVPVRPAAGVRRTETGQGLGRYQVKELLGRGASGAVYRAWDPELRRWVALKVPRLGELAMPDDLDRLVREARSAASLRHPGIVTLLDVVREDHFCFLVQEYVAGETLAARLRTSPPDVRQAARIVEQVARALHHAHEHGVIHRDLKPSNILLDAEGRPHLADFGLARCSAASTATVEGQVLGTPAYMPPEQARGDSHLVDARGDVYSLGAILYEMLTGSVPFPGHPRAVLRQVLDEEPRPPRRLNEAVPRDLEAICLHALAKEPGQRYASAAELAEDLGRFLNSQPVRARPVGTARRMVRWARRKPVLAGLSAALLLTGVLGFGLVSWQWWRADSLRRLAEAHVAEVERQRVQARNQFHLAHATVWNFINVPEPGGTQPQPTRQELLQRGARYYQEFLRRWSDDPAMDLALGMAHRSLAEIHAERGELEQVQGRVRQALDRSQALLAREPDAAEAWYLHAGCLALLAASEDSAGHLEAARTQCAAARAAWQRLGELDPTRAVDVEIGLGGCDRLDGSLHNRQGNASQAIRCYTRMYERFTLLGQQHPDRPDHRLALADSCNLLAWACREAKQPNEVLRYRRQQGELYEELLRQYPGQPFYRQQLASYHQNLAQAHRAARQRADANRHYRRAVELYRELARDNPALAAYRHSLASCLWSLANEASETEQPREAIRFLHECRQLWEQLAREEPGQNNAVASLGNVLALEGKMHDKRGDREAALRCHQQGAQCFEDCVREQPSVPRWRERLQSRYLRSGTLLLELNRPEEALSWLRRALAESEHLVADQPDNSGYRQGLAESWSFLGEALDKLERPEESLTAFRTAVAEQRVAVEKSRGDARQERALQDRQAALLRTLRGRGRTTEAEALAAELGKN